MTGTVNTGDASVSKTKMPALMEFTKGPGKRSCKTEKSLDSTCMKREDTAEFRAEK